MAKTTTHELKCLSSFFDAIQSGEKKFEIREERDRHFEVGDILFLREVEGDGSYTGKELRVYVKYIMRHKNFPLGIPEGYAVMSISAPWGRKEVKGSAYPPVNKR